MTATPQPGWIAVHPSTRFLYTVHEVNDFEGEEGGGVSAFAIDPDTGALRLLNSQRTPPLPCHCAVDATGQYLLVATFGGGTVHLFDLASDGRIGAETDAHQHTGSSVHPRRQTRPHAHAVALDPANRFVLVPDLGTDRVVVYECDLQRGKLLPCPEQTVQVPPGSGPRHLVFDAGARFAYLMNEISATIIVFAYDARCGALQEVETIDLLPERFEGLRSGAALDLSPDGRFLYATTRSHGSSGEPPVRGLDSIVWFRIDRANGTLALQGRVSSGGEIPRSFTLDARGEYLFVGHQASHSIVAFRLDPHTGEPLPTGEIVQTPVPVCLRFMASDVRG